ncbi:TIM-barrel domain-containing protein [Streptomyces sp. NPDC002055]|uniref:glycoside hydrolase family 31 protein n=1 Tax=Streptomyces sp. NPDC002055 TaxID=3154534 RepID=UPI00332F80FD
MSPSDGTRPAPSASATGAAGNSSPPPASSPPPVRLEFGDAEHVLRVEPWGADSVRVRAARHRVRDDLPGALTAPPAAAAAESTEGPDGSRILTVGRLRVELSPRGLLRFVRTQDGIELLRESVGHFAWPGARQFTPVGEGGYRLDQRFAAYEGERFFGLGQHSHGRLDHKHMVIDLVQRNGEVTIPFTLSSRGYGLLWNLPAVGRVELAAGQTRWVADAADQIDYWVTTGPTPGAIMSNYADATGHAPLLPERFLGLWQSRLRYRTQEELLDVAREYRRRGLPLSVIAVDYFHWPHLGDWCFDAADWPDPAGMVAELESMGVRPLVSVWPSVSVLSENYAPMRDERLLLRTEQGQPFQHVFPDSQVDHKSLPVVFYDPTDERAREYLWSRVKRNYYDLGFRLWWLDACEPEMYPEQCGNLRYAAGPGRAVANLYPREHVRGFYEHMRAEGVDVPVSLVRSAWAGSQAYAAALWSGDIPATFEALAVQVRAGLSAGLSGIPWWTTDIGGFHGGDPDDPGYRELLIRWFQFAVFCPLLRMHGYREPRDAFAAGRNGGPNELWSYGQEAYGILTRQLRLRQDLRPYLHQQMASAAERGAPVIRPLFFDFPDDPAAWTVEDQFLCGPDLLISPVTRLGERRRRVHLPAGADWVDPATGTVHDGDRTVTADAPLERIPVFLRHGSTLDVRFPG